MSSEHRLYWKDPATPGPALPSLPKASLIFSLKHLEQSFITCQVNIGDTVLVDCLAGSGSTWDSWNTSAALCFKGIFEFLFKHFEQSFTTCQCQVNIHFTVLVDCLAGSATWDSGHTSAAPFPKGIFEFSFKHLEQSFITCQCQVTIGDTVLVDCLAGSGSTWDSGHPPLPSSAKASLNFCLKICLSLSLHVN